MDKNFIFTLASVALLCGCSNEQKNTESNIEETTAKTLKVSDYNIPFSEVTTNPKEGKSVLIVEGSPRHNGNTDMLADEFAKGATEAGGKVEKIFLGDYDLKFLSEEGADKPHESMRETDNWKLVEKFLNADVVVLSSPVYYMNVTDRMKTFIDATYLAFGDEKMGGKEYYYITACADNVDATAEDALFAFRGFVFCLPSATERGAVKAVGIGRKGAVEGTQYMNEAYELGKTINKQ